jgi:hypothetical protein
MVQEMTLSGDADVVAAWKEALALSRRVGFSLFKEACLSGAVLELCRQVVERGAKGSCQIVDVSDGAVMRARVTIDGCAADLLGSARGRLSREIHVGPALPAVKLHQVVESLKAEASTSGARVILTIHQNRASAKAAFRVKPARR